MPVGTSSDGNDEMKGEFLNKTQPPHGKLTAALLARARRCSPLYTCGVVVIQKWYSRSKPGQQLANRVQDPTNGPGAAARVTRCDGRSCRTYIRHPQALRTGSDDLGPAHIGVAGDNEDDGGEAEARDALMALRTMLTGKDEL